MTVSYLIIMYLLTLYFLQTNERLRRPGSGDQHKRASTNKPRMNTDEHTNERAGTRTSGDEQTRRDDGDKQHTVGTTEHDRSYSREQMRASNHSTSSCCCC